jgi:hypothetical protein
MDSVLGQSAEMLEKLRGSPIQFKIFCVAGAADGGFGRAGKRGAGITAVDPQPRNLPHFCIMRQMKNRSNLAQDNSNNLNIIGKCNFSDLATSILLGRSVGTMVKDGLWFDDIWLLIQPEYQYCPTRRSFIILYGS